MSWQSMKEDDDVMKCKYRECHCTVEEGEEYCCDKCQRSDRSERPIPGCRCQHEDCQEEE